MKKGDKVILDQGFIFAVVVEIIEIGAMIKIRDYDGNEWEVSKYRLSYPPKFDIIDSKTIEIIIKR